MPKEMKKAIVITYRIKMPEKPDEEKSVKSKNDDNYIDYTEYFVPYSGKELRKLEKGKAYSALFSDNEKNDFDFCSPQNYESDSQILPDTANIVMDFIYCVCAAFSLADY